MSATRRRVLRLLTIGMSLLLAVGLTLTLPGCSDDPILGPNDGKKPEGGGSYSSIKRLSPSSTAADSTAPTTASAFPFAEVNPERF